MFPRALCVAGTLRILHSLSWFRDEHLEEFPFWLAGAKHLITLLHFRHNRDKFLQLCLRGSKFEHVERLFQHQVPMITDWRCWGNIIHVIELLLPLKVALRRAFRANAFCGDRGGPDDALVGDAQPPSADDFDRARQGKLDPPAIEQVIRDRFCWAYSHMLFALHNACEGLRVWSESCSCHGWIHQLSARDGRRFSELRRAQGLLGEDGADFVCPMAGLRAQKFAAGEWRAARDQVFDWGYRDFMQSVEFDDGQMSVLVRNFEKANVLAYDEVMVKF